MRAAHSEHIHVEHSELPAEKQRIAMINDLKNFLLLAAMWNNWHSERTVDQSIFQNFHTTICFTSRL